MWDLKICEKEPEKVVEALMKRGADFNGQVDDLVAQLAGRRSLIAEIDSLNMARKRIAKNGTDGARDRARDLRAKASRLKDDLAVAEQKIHSTVAMMPNRPHASVPAGATDADNIVVKEWGKPREFDFEFRDHVDIGHDLGLLDLPRGTKIAGSGFPCLKGWGAVLNRAVKNFMLDLHCRHRGYVEVAPPFVTNREAFFGTGQLPKFEDELYWTENDQLGLVPTAEVPLTNLYANEILDAKDLPIRMTAYTPCWRREAGSHGRDTRGIIRVHQFEKVELVKLAAPETSYEELEMLADDAEEILRQLDLPHRRVLLCAGDMGFGAAKTYDIEVWIPSQNCYREISSCSNCEDFQARRMMLRFRNGSGKVEYVHTLNGSGLAIGRTLVAIIENYQLEDGSIEVPKALVPYVGADVIEPDTRLP